MAEYVPGDVLSRFQMATSIVGVEPAALGTTLYTGAVEEQGLRLSNAGASPLAFSLSVVPTRAGGEACAPARVLVTDWQGGLSAVDPVTGAATLIAPGLRGPHGLTLRPGATTAYVLEGESGDLVSIDLLTGSVRTVKEGLADIVGIALEPGGSRALMVSWSGTAALLDLLTGASTQIVSGLEGPTGVALDPSGAIAYVTESGVEDGGLDRVDLQTGAVARIASGLIEPDGVALDGSGTTAFVVEYGGGRLLAVDLSTGAVRTVAEGMDLPLGVALDPQGTTAYVLEAYEDEIAVVDVATGALMRVVPGLSGLSSIALSLDPACSPVFLRLDTTAGTIPASGFLDLLVRFDALWLSGGTYRNDIRVASDDPATPVLAVPALLNVVDAPDVRTSPSSLAFPPTFTGATSSLPLAIRNQGSQDLHISGVWFEGEFSHSGLEPPEVTPVGGWREITVTFSPTVPGQAFGRLVLESDDPDAPSLSVALSGEALLPPVLEVTPTSLTAALSPGGRETPTLRLANAGGSDLTFAVGIRLVGAGTTSASPRTPSPETAGVSGISRLAGAAASLAALASGQGSPGEFDLLPSSPARLTRVVEDPATLSLYAQAQGGMGFYRYWAGSDVWQSLAPAPSDDLNVAGAALLNGKVYTSYYWPEVVLGVYDIAADSWSTLPAPLGAPVDTIASDGSRYLYLIGGDSFMRLDPASGETQALPSPPFHFLWWGGLRFLDGKLYGHEWDGTGFCSFDIAANAWQFLPSIPGRADMGSAIDPFAREYYAYGEGMQGGLYRFSLESQTWSILTIPFFYVFDGGMGWLPGPGLGIYFVEGEEGTGFARFNTGTPFITVNPPSGTVPPGGSTILETQFDARHLLGGTYAARIDLATNDPAQPLLSVPATLRVVGVPDADARPASLSFPATYTGHASPLTFTVRNLGTNALHIDSVWLEGEFSESGLAPPETLPIGGMRTITVTYSPTIPGQASGRLILECDDPDESALEVALTGMALAPPVISIPPPDPPLDITLAAGDRATRSLAILNSGGSDLVFSLGVRGAPGQGTLTGTPTPEDGIPGEFERLHSSPEDLSCLVADPANQVIYGLGSAIHRYEAASDTWDGLAPCPIREPCASTALLNGKIFTSHESDLLGVYDIATNSWSTLPNPMGFDSSSIASDGSRYLYLVRGTSFVRLDPASGDVTNLPAPLFEFNSYGGMRYLDGSLYGHQGAYAAFSRFDVDANEWTLLPPFPKGAANGPAIDPVWREYFAVEKPYRGNLNQCSIDNGTCRVLTIPLFSGGLEDTAWLPGPVAAVYFTEGYAGAGHESTGFGRLITRSPFLSVSPMTGTVPPGGSETIQVHFDASNLPVAVYNGHIDILTNDPIHGSLSVPASLQVLEDADQDGSPDPFDNCPAVYNPGQEDADHDAAGDVCDNCPATYNAGQLDSNADGSGDACQPTLTLSGIRQDGGPVLEVRALARDPQGESLSGNVRIYPAAPAHVVVPDQVAAGGCDSGLPVDGDPREGIGYANATIGGPHLFELDGFMRCLGGRADFGMAPGTCTEPSGPFDIFVDLPDLPLPAPLCVRRISAPQNAFALTVIAYDDTTVTLDPGAPAPPLLDYPFTDWPPRGDSLSSLTSGESYRLVITLTDGNTVPVSAEGPFLYQGESVLLFNNPPAASVAAVAPVECDRPAGGPVLLDGSASQDPDSSPGTQNDIVRFDWILDPGQPGEAALGSGEVLPAVVPLGSHTVALRVTDAAGESDTTSIPASVVDTAPPVLTLAGAPGRLWPPNHRLVPVDVSWQVTDLCTAAPAVFLVSAASSEPDDAEGDGDGETTGDIGGTDPGTPDTEVDLRAERDGTGPSRTYTLTYQATDAAGNPTLGTVRVQVPHDLGAETEPMQLRLEPIGTSGKARISWNSVTGATSYDLILGDLASVVREPNLLSLGAVSVLAARTANMDLQEGPEVPVPPQGKVFFYLMQSHGLDGSRSGYGSESAPLPRAPESCGGGCP